MKPGFFKPQNNALSKTDNEFLYAGIAFYGIAAVGLIAYLPLKTIMITRPWLGLMTLAQSRLWIIPT